MDRGLATYGYQTETDSLASKNLQTIEQSERDLIRSKRRTYFISFDSKDQLEREQDSTTDAPSASGVPNTSKAAKAEGSTGESSSIRRFPGEPEHTLPADSGTLRNTQVLGNSTRFSSEDGARTEILGAEDTSTNLPDRTSTSERMEASRSLVAPTMVTTDPGPKPEPSEFRVAIICAKTLECDAVVDTLDGQHHEMIPQIPNHNMRYAWGRMNGIPVVLYCSLEQGNIEAGTAAQDIDNRFHPDLIMLVGVCGGVPQPPNRPEISLGDVIVGKSVVDYAYRGRIVDGGRLERRTEQKLRNVAPVIARTLQWAESRGMKQMILESSKAKFAELVGRYKDYRRPSSKEDWLFPVDYPHVHRGPVSEWCGCKIEPYQQCEQVKSQVCQTDGVCEKEKTIRLHLEERDEFKIHSGLFGCADNLMVSTDVRNELAEKGVVAFDMEASGVFEPGKGLVIKAVSDYADSHKNKSWQEHAAAMAACVAYAYITHCWPSGGAASLIHYSLISSSQSLIRGLASGLQARQSPDYLSGGTLRDHADYAASQTRDNHTYSDADPEVAQGRILDGPPVGRLHKKYQNRLHIEEELGQTSLAIIEKKGKTPTLISLHGLGGSGKSQLCLEFFRQNSGKFTFSLWVDASTTTTIKQAYAKVADRVQLPSRRANKAECFSEWLTTQNGTWLLVLDNMDSDNADDVLDTYVPRMGHGYVLITSIREITRAHGIKVGNLDPVSAQNLFASILERTPTKEEKVASDQLLQQLDYFPLAINLSATFIHERREAVTTYKTEWNKLLVSLDPTDSNRTLKATIKRSYEHMTYDTQLPHALQLLHFFSCINSQQASEKILERAWQSLYNTANQGTIDRGFSKVILSVFKVSWKDFEEQDVRIQPHWDAVKVEIRTALSLLAKYAFLDFHGDIGRNETGHESWVHIHKIVREFIKYDSDCLKDWLQTTRFTLILALTDTPSIDTGRLIIPHLEHVLEGDKVFETLLPGNNRLFEAAIRVSDAYSLCGHTQETLTLRKKIYHRVKKNDEDRVCDEIPTSALIKATSFLADAYANVSQYEAALKYSHKAYGWEEQRIGKSKGDKFAFLQYGKGLARIYERLGFHEEAYFYRQKALSCSKALDHTGTSPQTLRIEALSADSLNHLGRHKEATEILESTIEQFELQDKLTGIPMHHLLESKYALAKSYDACNRLRDALRERRYILKERRAVDETHQATGIAMLGVANSLYGLGDFAEALELREQSVRLFQKLEDRIPPRDPSILNAKYSLAKSYRKRASQRMSGKYIDLSGATQDISNAVDLNTQIMQAGDLKEPAHHPEVLDCLNEQARCLCYQAKIKMAVAKGSSALKPGARWGESDIMVECFQECLKLQTRILEHWKEVKIRVETKTGVGFEMVVDTNTLDCKILEAENRIAMYHCDFGRLEEAWSMNEAVRKKLEDIKKPKDPLVTAYSDGARILMARRSQHRSSDKGKAKLLHEARKLCLDAYNKSVDNLGNQHKDTIKVLELLAGYTKKPEDYEKLLKVHDEVFGSTHQKSTATLKKLLSSYANLKGSSCYSSRIQFLERRQKEMTQTQQT